MIISKKTKHTQKTVKVPSIRINKNGHIVFNKAAVQLLEIEDNEKEGVVFGYQNNEPYVAYSTDEDCYKGMFKVGETSFRFGSKYESEQILSCFNVEDKSIVLSVSDEPKEIVMSEGYKFLKLKRSVAISANEWGIAAARELAAPKLINNQKFTICKKMI